MTPWLVHELRSHGLEVTCLDARHARAALKMWFFPNAGWSNARSVAEQMRPAGQDWENLNRAFLLLASIRLMVSGPPANPVRVSSSSTLKTVSA
jgi:hypothetical protein